MKKKRFYPDTLPEFEYEPDFEAFQILQIGSESGQGIITRKAFNPGDIVFRFTGFLLTEVSLFSLQIRPGLHLHDPFFMGKVLHSCNPNMLCDMQKRTFTACKTIYPGDIITMDYETTEDRLFRPFRCVCGADNCRGLIRGKKVVEVESLTVLKEMDIKLKAQ